MSIWLRFPILALPVLFMTACFLDESSSIAKVSSTSGVSSSVVSSSSRLSSAKSSSSMPLSSSSFSATSTALNNQNCTYNSTANTLACAEKIYKTVTIGAQIWMAENLNYGTFVSDGDSRSHLQNGAQKYCYLDTESNCATDGGLYQWHTAMGIASSYASASYTVPSGHIQGICPNGWHLPKDAEWDALQSYLGGSSLAGKKMKANNSGFINWDAPTYNDGNSSGFSAVPAGDRVYYGGFYDRGYSAFFWEAEQYSSPNAWGRSLNVDYSGLNRYNDSKASGFSIRCVRD